MAQFKFVASAMILLVLLSSAIALQATPLHLILLGTGYPYPTAERAGPSCAVIAGKKVFIIDAGRGTVMRLAATGIQWSAIEAVFLTHLHSDHIDGLPDLYHSTWQFGNPEPFRLYGPKGTKGIADGMLQFYGPDIHIRRDLTEMIPGDGAKIEAREILQGVVYEIPGELRITAFTVDHHPVEPAFGYRFDSGQHSIVITGDTRPNSNLVRYAEGADILVHEAYVRPDSSAGPENAAHWSIYDYHTSAKEAGETAEKAGVKMLVLTHLIPASADEKHFLDEAQKAFSGVTIVGRDLLSLTTSDAKKSK
jgi:ribonuclease Z